MGNMKWVHLPLISWLLHNRCPHCVGAEWMAAVWWNPVSYVVVWSCIYCCRTSVD